MSKDIAQWAVVGAGPAGIAVVGKLLDHGVPAKEILWFDSHFQVGDFGLYWRNVSSNTKVRYFKDFLNEVRSFDYKNAPVDFEINSLPPEETCDLKYVAEPLQWISDHLAEKVHSETLMIRGLFIADRIWNLHADSQTFRAKNVVLAIGAAPSVLDHSGVHHIPFTLAIDKEKLAEVVKPDQTIGVFGSSHSAMVILKHLVELNVKKIINFYRSPCFYAIELDECILFDNTGLKGNSALWARQNIDGLLPKNLVRYPANETSIAHFLPECDQVIYSVGFERRQDIETNHYELSQYNSRIGIIGPGLFGCGIAYPETKLDPFGNEESQVGLWKFMVYLNKVLPVWFKYHA